MPKTQYSVTEVSKLLNVSRVTAYNRIKKYDKLLTSFVKTVNNVMYLEQAGLDILMNNIESLQINKEPLQHIDEVNNNSNEDAVMKDESSDVKVLSSLNEVLNNEVESLKKQLQDKHEYINSFHNQLITKDKQIEELNKALSQSQQLNENNQILLRESTKKTLLLEEKNTKKWWTFWN